MSKRERIVVYAEFDLANADPEKRVSWLARARVGNDVIESRHPKNGTLARRLLRAHLRCLSKRPARTP